MDRKVILIIEDDPELSDIFATILSANGWETEIIRDGQLAMPRIVALLPDIILLDMHLPNVSGLEILAQLRANKNLKETKVVVITADAGLAKHTEKEADLALIKPVTFDQITELTARLFTSKKG